MLDSTGLCAVATEVMGAHLCIKADKEEFSTPKEERPAVFDPKLIYYDKDGNLRLGRLSAMACPSMDNMIMLGPFTL
jgi:hypothetical protein